jgi:hypothetical protein
MNTDPSKKSARYRQCMNGLEKYYIQFFEHDNMIVNEQVQKRMKYTLWIDLRPTIAPRMRLTLPEAYLSYIFNIPLTSLKRFLLLRTALLIDLTGL